MTHVGYKGAADVWQACCTNTARCASTVGWEFQHVGIVRTLRKGAETTAKGISCTDQA
jgi:hypothetical protein